MITTKLVSKDISADVQIEVEGVAHMRGARGAAFIPEVVRVSYLYNPEAEDSWTVSTWNCTSVTVMGTRMGMLGTAGVNWITSVSSDADATGAFSLQGEPMPSWLVQLVNEHRPTALTA